MRGAQPFHKLWVHTVLELLVSMFQTELSPPHYTQQAKIQGAQGQGLCVRKSSAERRSRRFGDLILGYKRNKTLWILHQSIAQEEGQADYLKDAFFFPWENTREKTSCRLGACFGKQHSGQRNNVSRM